MSHTRRALLAAGATGIALTAGCLDFVLGNGPLKFSAERAAPTDAALATAGFAEHEVSEETVEETIEPAGVEREIEATYWISAYTRDIEVRDERRTGAAFAAVSTPEANVFGESYNPVAEMDNEEILEEYGDEMNEDGDDPIENLEREGTTSLPILGDDRGVDVFVGEREYKGESVEVEVLVSTIQHEDDFLVVLGSYPLMDSLRNALEATLEAEAEQAAEEAAEEQLETVEEAGGDVDEELEDEVEEEAEEEAKEETEEEIEEALPDDLSGDVETLFEELEHPV